MKNRRWFVILPIAILLILYASTLAESQTRGIEITYNGVPLEEMMGTAAEMFADAVEENVGNVIDGLNAMLDELTVGFSESLGMVETTNQDVSFDYFCYSNMGVSADQIYSYEIERDEESGEWKVIYELYCGNSLYILPADTELMQKISAIMVAHDLHAWDGFKKSKSIVLDGSGFMLTIDFADGSSIHATGDNSFPEGFSEAKRAIDELFYAYLEKNGIDPEGGY